MLKEFVITVVSLFAGAATAYLDCSGCERDPQHDGGGAGNEVWSYTPGVGNKDGHCTPGCSYDEECEYTGVISFSNNAFPPGGGSRNLFDQDGVKQNPGAPIACPGSFGGMAVNIKAPCGAAGGAARKFVAKDVGGNQTSAFIFYCLGCSTDPE